MAGTLRKTMLYLGLADDRGEAEEQEYMDDYDDADGGVGEDFAPVTPIGRAPAYSPVREVRETRPAPSQGVDLRRIVTVHPRSYNDALVIGDAFRAGTPVIINLSDMDDADAKRLVDFSAGLTFGLHGAIERVTNKVFLLSPEHVEVTGEERAAAGQPRGAGIYNQS
ncbi:cell division protein SepF [Luteimicrobium album]|jgi:cell division inhibitor SepF|uniref:Cell division protein SepF n=1 Tax=Luteimicrobium album TaxID=1054550 RepID=A0ABQ6I6N1_9MICO|nr:cell division protein SepF [Luteimicrobium album]GMA26381.1 cell division protein SepF [Luteimicrobium album]